MGVPGMYDVSVVLNPNEMPPLKYIPHTPKKSNGINMQLLFGIIKNDAIGKDPEDGKLGMSKS